jgi:hypothetical protein
MIVVPVTFRQACQFVAKLHRHNKPPRGHKFSIGVVVGDELVGVAMASRPVARALDDGFTLEVVRTCTDGTAHVNSKLYGAVWRAGKAMGYRRCVTYTQHGEPGTSLRAAGWRLDTKLAPRGSWLASTADERLRNMRDQVGNGGVERARWVIDCGQGDISAAVAAMVRDLPRAPVRRREDHFPAETAPFTATSTAR